MLFFSGYFVWKIGIYRDPNFMKKSIIFKPIFRMKNRDISRSIFFGKNFFVLIFFGIYHLENREISAIFFPADLRSLNWRFFFLGWTHKNRVLFVKASLEQINRLLISFLRVIRPSDYDLKYHFGPKMLEYDQKKLHVSRFAQLAFLMTSSLPRRSFYTISLKIGVRKRFFFALPQEVY